MQNFSSLFEFLAALNSAYIASNYFLATLLTVFHRDFQILIQKLEIIEKNQEENKLRMLRGLPRLKQYAGEDAPKQLHEQCEAVSQQILDLKSRVISKMNSTGISTFFNFMCLIGALYSITMLVLIGVGYQFKHSVTGYAFILFSLLISGFCLLIFITKKLAKKPRMKWLNYNAILLYYFISSLFLIVAYCIDQFGSWNPKISFLPTNGFLFQRVPYTLSMIIPAAHFFYYFIASRYWTKRHCRSLNGEFDGLEKQSREFAISLGSKFELIETIKNRPVEPSVPGKAVPTRVLINSQADVEKNEVIITQQVKPEQQPKSPVKKPIVKRTTKKPPGK